MSEYKLKPTRWYYVLAILIPIFACMGTALFVYGNVPKLPGALEALGVKNLTQVVIPGSAEIHFPKSGAYAVYYEYRSVIDGASYYRDEYPPSIRCQLRSKVTDKAVKLAPSTVKGNVYTSHSPADGRSYPKNVMAVGPNLVWEFFNIAVKPIAAMLFGSIAFVFAGVISVLIIAFVAIKRHQSKNILASQD